MPTADTKDRRFRFDRAELAGSLGDLGTFIPLLVGMVNRCGLQLGPALLAAGVMNIVTGLAFRIPMPVQPMKAIATVAIAEGLSESQILIAGILTGLFLLVVGVTGLLDVIDRLIPRSVVRGLQLAFGLKLIASGFSMVANTQVWLGWDSIGLGIGCGLAVLLLYSSTRIPGALVVFALGMAALFLGETRTMSEAALGISWSLPTLTNSHDWVTGLWKGAIPQIPLTLLNSVIAVCALSCDLFPHRPAAPKKVAVSVAIMNLIACPLGGMPMCHGAGGLAGQYRFGARSGGGVVMLGVIKCALALLLGGSLMIWLEAYPSSVLGTLLLFSGLELAQVCRDQRTRSEFVVMLMTAGPCLALNTALGFAVGLMVAISLRLRLFRIEPSHG